jgi:hypothetical protein
MLRGGPGAVPGRQRLLSSLDKEGRVAPPWAAHAPAVHHNQVTHF